MRPFREHPDAARRRLSAISAARAILALELYDAHKRELLRACIWKLTEADADHKHRTRYRTRAALSSDDVEHEHVVQQRVLVEALPSCIPMHARSVWRRFLHEVRHVPPVFTPGTGGVRPSTASSSPGACFSRVDRFMDHEHTDLSGKVLDLAEGANDDAQQLAGNGGEDVGHTVVLATGCSRPLSRWRTGSGPPTHDESENRGVQQGLHDMTLPTGHLIGPVAPA